MLKPWIVHGSCFSPQPEPEKEKEVKATLASLEPMDEIPFPNTVQKHILEYEQVK